MNRLLLDATVFVCGAVVMILEIVGARILAPHLGTSIVVWTGLIGVVLAALSLGYYWGGRLADARPEAGRLAFILFLAGIFVAGTWLGHGLIFDVFKMIGLSLPLGATLAALVLFGPASVLLGMITPFAARLALADLARSGATVGRLYALSTVGSIVGTFLAGFVLLSLFGSRGILAVLAGILIILSCFVAPKMWLKQKMAVLAMLGLGLMISFISHRVDAEQGRVDLDTAYNRIQIYQGLEAGTNRMKRVMVTGPKYYQSAVYVDQPEELALAYTRFFRLMNHFKPDAKKVLVIGGGGFAFPRELLRVDKGVRVDVVEIDPAFTELAKRYFFLKPSDRLNVHHEDARVYLNRPGEKVDVILGDAFNSAYSVPFQLISKEAVQAMAERLTTDGVLLVNLITGLDGPNGCLFRAVHATLSTVFPQVLAFPVDNPLDGNMVQNIMLVALKGKKPFPMETDDPEMLGYLDHLWTRPVEQDVPVLTDDFAPVDRYMVGMMARD